MQKECDSRIYFDMLDKTHTFRRSVGLIKDLSDDDFFSFTLRQASLCND